MMLFVFRLLIFGFHDRRSDRPLPEGKDLQAEAYDFALADYIRSNSGCMLLQTSVSLKRPLPSYMFDEEEYRNLK